MRKTPDPKKLEICMDGVGADIGDVPMSDQSAGNSSRTRKYTVRYIIPTVTSNDAKVTHGDSRNMSVSAQSAEDAVRTVLVAHPNADISSVDC